MEPIRINAANDLGHLNSFMYEDGSGDIEDVGKVIGEGNIKSNVPGTEMTSGEELYQMVCLEFQDVPRSYVDCCKLIYRLNEYDNHTLRLFIEVCYVLLKGDELSVPTPDYGEYFVRLVQWLANGVLYYRYSKEAR